MRMMWRSEPVSRLSTFLLLMWLGPANTQLDLHTHCQHMRQIAKVHACHSAHLGCDDAERPAFAKRP